MAEWQLRCCDPCSAVPAEFRSIDEVQQALAKAGLDSSQLVLGVDFQRNSLWTADQTGYDSDPSGRAQISFCFKRSGRTMRGECRNASTIDRRALDLAASSKKKPHLDGNAKPYQTVIKVLGNTLDPFGNTPRKDSQRGRGKTGGKSAARKHGQKPRSAGPVKDGGRTVEQDRHMVEAFLWK